MLQSEHQKWPGVHSRKEEVSKAHFTVCLQYTVAYTLILLINESLLITERVSDVQVKCSETPKTRDL